MTGSKHFANRLTPGGACYWKGSLRSKRFREVFCIREVFFVPVLISARTKSEKHTNGNACCLGYWKGICVDFFDGGGGGGAGTEDHWAYFTADVVSRPNIYVDISFKLF